MIKALDSYLNKTHTVLSYLTNSQNPASTRKTIVQDTLKCLAIGATLACLLRYTRGDCHYMRYVRSAVLGMGFGLGYSVLFTVEKVEVFVAQGRVEDSTRL